MRRKSSRSGKASPERKQAEPSKKPRRQSRRRRRSSSKSDGESGDEAKKTNTKESIKDAKENVVQNLKVDEEPSHTPEVITNVSLIGHDENLENSVGHSSELKNDIEEEKPELETEEKEEKKTKGKSKGNKSNIEQSSNYIEPEIENENVQGTPQSPSNDNADNENIQTVNDNAQADMGLQENKLEAENQAIAKEQSVQSEVNFESEYVQESAEAKNQERESSDPKSSEEHRKKSSSQEDDRSMTPEIKINDKGEHYNSRKRSSDLDKQDKNEMVENSSSKKKITLRRSAPRNKDNKNSEEGSSKERRSTTEDSGKEIEDQEEKPRKKITLKRRNIDDQSQVHDQASNEEKIGDVEEYSRQSSEDQEKEKKERLSSISEDRQSDGKEKIKKPLKKIKLIRTVSNLTDDGHDEKSRPSTNQRRLPWQKSDWLDKLNSSFYKIDVDAIKIVCPSLQFLAEDEVRLEASPPERRKSEIELKRKVSIEKSDDERPVYEKQSSEDSSAEVTVEHNPNIIALNRKISIVDDTASKLRPPPSPARNPISEVLYISNLVRPFTVKQLKELLERTGKIKEGGFWTDRIKSKCYVQYETEAEAEATRNALHGVHWPIGNGKKLVIEYATVEDLDKAKNPAPPPKPIVDKLPEKENREPPKTDKLKEGEPEREEKKKRDGQVREWDMGKEESHRRRSRTRSRSRERVRKYSRRSYTPEVYPHRKQRKIEEPVPQKLMDDLFLKTKATPSIYWQPLSPEEIAMKQRQRLVRMEEHKRRIEETRVRVRDTRRGSFRRR